MKHHTCEQEADTFRSAIYGARETAGLPGKMEVEVQLKQMLEYVACDTPNRLLSNAREDRVPQFLEKNRANSSCTI